MGVLGRRAVLAGLAVAGLLACQEEKPFTLDDNSLGVRAVFPAEARMAKYSEDTPFGRVDWFSYTCSPGNKLDFASRVEVGNLPPGTQGGTTPDEVLATYNHWLGQRLKGYSQNRLPAVPGPGFRYHATLGDGGTVDGIVVVRRGRLHHAQITSGKPGDPRVKAFLDSFSVK
nr:hypothetical protein [uncultured Holophaga sp.]